MKILLLIICGGQDGGDGGKLYRKMFEMQKQYWFSHPHIDTYTIQMDEKLEKDISLCDNKILVRGEENLSNVLYKTIKALELLTDNGKSNKYDYIVRSNVSTVIDFDRLYDYCKLKITNLYTGGRMLYLEWTDKECGINDEKHFGTPFVQGCFIIMSMDVVNQLLQNLNKLDFTIIDDVSIAIFIKKYTSIDDNKIRENMPSFCLDNVRAGKTKLKDYTNREFVAYRNHREPHFSWGDREADLEEIKNQIKCIYNI